MKTSPKDAIANLAVYLGTQFGTTSPQQWECYMDSVASLAIASGFELEEVIDFFDPFQIQFKQRWQDQL